VGEDGEIACLSWDWVGEEGGGRTHNVRPYELFGSFVIDENLANRKHSGFMGKFSKKRVNKRHTAKNVGGVLFPQNRLKWRLQFILGCGSIKV